MPGLYPFKATKTKTEPLVSELIHSQDVHRGHNIYQRPGLKKSKVYVFENTDLKAPDLPISSTFRLLPSFILIAKKPFTRLHVWFTPVTQRVKDRMSYTARTLS